MRGTLGKLGWGVVIGSIPVATGFAAACLTLWVLRGTRWRCSARYVERPAEPGGPVDQWLCPDGMEYTVPFVGTWLLVAAAVAVFLGLLLRRRAVRRDLATHPAGDPRRAAGPHPDGDSHPAPSTGRDAASR